MRILDEFELSVLKKIKTLTENGLDITFKTLIDDLIEDKGIKVDFERHKAFLLFDGLKFSRLEGSTRIPQFNLDAEGKIVFKNIIRVIILLKYLEKEGTLFKINGNAKNDIIVSYARITNDAAPIESEINDDKFISLLVEYLSASIFINEGSLEYFLSGHHQNNSRMGSDETFPNDQLQILSNIENNVKETLGVMEDYYYLSEKRIKNADVALTIAIVLGILCIALTGLSTYFTFQKLDESAQLTSLYLEPLHQRLTAIEEGFFKIHKKMDEIRINDTIHTKVVQLPMDTLHSKVINFPTHQKVIISKKSRPKINDSLYSKP